MAFSGGSRTLTSVLPGAGSNTSEFSVSTEDWNKVLSEVDEFYTQTMMKNLPTRRCYAIDIKNNEPVKPMKLQTKETVNLFSKLSAKAKGLVYIQHSIIYLLYIPTILETTSGLVSIKLFNTNTGESIDVDTDSPANEAAIFVCRWPRSIHADDGDGIHLLVNATSMDCKNLAKVGTFYPLWDDSVHKKKLYEKMYPTLRFPIEKSEAIAAVDDIKILQSMAKSRIVSATRSLADINPVAIEMKPIDGGKARTVDFKTVKVPVKYGNVNSEGSNSNVEAVPIEKAKRVDGVTTSS